MHTELRMLVPTHIDMSTSISQCLEGTVPRGFLTFGLSDLTAEPSMVRCQQEPTSFLVIFQSCTSWYL